MGNYVPIEPESTKRNYNPNGRSSSVSRACPPPFVLPSRLICTWLSSECPLMNPSGLPSDSGNPQSAPSPSAHASPTYVTEVATGAAEPVKLRVSTKTIAIVFLVLGVAGILATLFQTAVAAIVYLVTRGQTGDPNLDRISQSLSNDLSVQGLSLHAIGLVLAVLAIIGGIGTLRRKLGYAVLLRRTALFMAIFGVVRSGIAIDSQLRNKETFIQDMQAQLAANPDPNLPDLGPLVSVLFFVTLGFGLLMSLAFASFYLWSYFHLRKPEIVAQMK